MAGKLEQLKNNLEATLGSRIVSVTQALGEITVVVNAADYVAAAQALHDDPHLRHGLNVWSGHITHEAVAHDLGLEGYLAPEAAIAG